VIAPGSPGGIDRGRAVPWLTRDAEVLAAVERRTRGYPDRDTGGAVVLRRPLLVHAPRSASIDVAWCRPAAAPTGAPGSEVVEVLRVRTLGRRLPTAATWRSPVVIVANAGAFERWRLGVGDRLEITGD
jgi:hypothetical protein